MQIKEELESLNLKVLHLQRAILLLKKGIRELDEQVNKRGEELDIAISRIEVDLEELNKFFAQLDITEEVDISGHYSSQIP